MKTYKTIANDGLLEEDIKKSRFICQIKRVYSEEEGRAFITQVKKDHYKATHSCSAMIIGENADIKRSSDDGEPSGTAGVPMLTVLEKNGLTNVVVVVTRYFGGIKLGAGGLIRAYGGAVAHAIKALGIVEIKEQEGIAIQLTYPQYQTFANFLTQENLQEHETDFSVEVTSKVFLDKENISGFMDRLIDFYQGKITTSSAGCQIVEVPVTPALDYD